MDSQQISAFAAFSQRKAKSLEKKPKQKKKQKGGQQAKINVTEPHKSQTKGKKNKKNNFNKKALIKSVLEAQKQSLLRNCAVINKMNNIFVSGEAPKTEGDKGNKKLRQSIEDISKLTKTKKMKLMNGLDIEIPETITSAHKIVETQVLLNGGVTLDLDGFPGKNFKPNQQNSSNGTKCDIRKMIEMRKKKKLMNKECIKNSKVNKKIKNTEPNKKNKNTEQNQKIKNPEQNQKIKNTEQNQKIKNTEPNEKIKNTEHKTLIQKKEAAAKSNLPEGNTDSSKLNGKSSISKDLDNKSGFPEAICTDGVKVGEEVFSWMISPLSVKDFFKNCWEQKPLHIQHNDKNYFKNICTLDDFKKALREHDMYFTRNIDVTSYIGGERRTENPEGKAKPSEVWDFYKKGRSIRLLNPQTFIQNVRVLNTTLQEFFHCFVGANIYLTPPGTQGFAPHYDDIEAFVLQLEGEKHWKLYNPRSPEEVLPRKSSRNFKEDEIGKPFLEVTLQPGDLLYFPRGIIHQAKCLPHVHSLHITVSCYQRNSWGDLMEKVIPVAIQKAISEDVEFRKGLPLGYLNRLGMTHSDQSSNERTELIKKFESLVKKIIDHCPLDAAADQLGASYIQDALPPCLSEVEEQYGADRNCKMGNENFLDALRNSSDKKLSVKLIRPTCVRLVAEEEELYLYYTTDNSLVYHEFEASSVNVSPEWAQALECLIRSYPNFVEMKALPVSLDINKPAKWSHIVDFVYFLWQKGLLLFNQPLGEICA